MNPEYFEEIRGLASGAELNYDKVNRIHAIGELWTFHCSMVGAWDDALQQKVGLIQVRALDWTIEAPYKDYPQLTVYHLDSKSNQHSFVNIGFSGFIGLITGVNSQRIGISEIGPWWVDRIYFPEESHDGLTS